MIQWIARLNRFTRSHPLTERNRVAAFRRAISWQIRSRFHDEVVFDWIGGAKLAIRRGMTGATGNVYAGLHEFADMAFLLHMLREGDLFLDVGANIGSYSVLASSVRGASTIAFEPDPGTYKALMRNIELNGIGRMVEARCEALGDHVGTTRFTLGLDTVNKVVDEGAGDAQSVPLNTLDSAVAGRPPLLMKMDVEGYETHVIAGAEQTLSNPALKAIVSESEDPAVVSILSRQGFSQVFYAPFERRFSERPVHSSGNALFVRDIGFLERRVTTADPVRVLGVDL